MDSKGTINVMKDGYIINIGVDTPFSDLKKYDRIDLTIIGQGRKRETKRETKKRKKREE